MYTVYREYDVWKAVAHNGVCVAVWSGHPRNPNCDVWIIETLGM